MFSADSTLGTHRWPVVKLKSGSRVEAILLRDRFFCVTTHWVGRSELCCVDDCPLCEFLPSRGLFYLPVACNSRRALLELGSLSASDLESHCKLLHGGIRPGLVVSFSRRGDKHPLHSEVVRVTEGVAAEDLITVAQRVMALFKFPPPNVGEDIDAYERRCRSIARVRCSRHAEALLKRPVKS